MKINVIKIYKNILINIPIISCIFNKININIEKIKKSFNFVYKCVTNYKFTVNTLCRMRNL